MWRLIGALVALAAGLWVPHWLARMPHPFDDTTAVAIPPARLALYPGGPDGAPVPARFEGALALNSRLQAATRLFQGAVFGSESVAVTPSGALVMLDRYGWVHFARPTRAGATSLYSGSGSAANDAWSLSQAQYVGPGRPLGFHLVGEETLYICDSLKGLTRLDLGTGRLEVLSNAVHSEVRAGQQPAMPLYYANDLDVAADGTVYFTSCTHHPVALNRFGFYDTMRSYLLSTLHGAADGRLLRWDPVTRRTHELLGGLSYANGVALSAGEDFVCVVETNTARVHRLWLSGPKQGQTDILIPSLPGIPDGISRSPDGGFWVALVAPISPLMAAIGPYRWARQLLSHWVEQMVPVVAKPWSGAVKFSPNGTAVQALYDPDGSRVSTLSAVTESKGKLFLGNLGGDYVSVVDL